MLYRVVRDHLETFCVQSAALRGGEGLPRFVEEEFRAYLRCGWLAAGFARFRCSACGADRLVAFSCKGRGFCPSCGARRMTALTAQLVDHVFPPVPVRQWVLSLPHRWSDGTTHVLFEPTEFLERLAVITPRPRVNLVLYYGVLAPRADWRAEVVGEGLADRAKPRRWFA